MFSSNNAKQIVVPILCCISVIACNNSSSGGAKGEPPKPMTIDDIGKNTQFKITNKITEDKYYEIMLANKIKSCEVDGKTDYKKIPDEIPLGATETVFSSYSSEYSSSTTIQNTLTSKSANQFITARKYIDSNVSNYNGYQGPIYNTDKSYPRVCSLVSKKNEKNEDHTTWECDDLEFKKDEFVPQVLNIINQQQQDTNNTTAITCTSSEISNDDLEKKNVESQYSEGEYKLVNGKVAKAYMVKRVSTSNKVCKNSKGEIIEEKKIKSYTVAIYILKIVRLQSLTYACYGFGSSNQVYSESIYTTMDGVVDFTHKTEVITPFFLPE